MEEKEKRKWPRALVGTAAAAAGAEQWDKIFPFSTQRRRLHFLPFPPPPPPPPPSFLSSESGENAFEVVVVGGGGWKRRNGKPVAKGRSPRGRRAGGG